jgi:predicted HAD superfamily Cof-like phosphohydrolase
MRESVQAVLEFHLKHGFPVNQSLSSYAAESARDHVAFVAEEMRDVSEEMLTSSDVVQQRLSLMLEEMAEICETMNEIRESRASVAQRVELADGLADLIYVVIGTAVAFGIPIDAVFNEVHRSNMTKNVCNEPLLKGKVSKGAGYSPPQIAKILEGR